VDECKPLVVGAVRNRQLLDTLVANLCGAGLAVAEEHLADNHGDDWYEDGYAAGAHTRSR
jgi:hypothetical protein